jgi:hypothetical protein
MEARTISVSLPVSSTSVRVALQLSRALAAFLVVGLILAATVIVVRRASGMLNVPLSAVSLVGTVVVAAIAAAGARWLIPAELSPSMGHWTAAAMRWSPAAALIALAAGVSLPGSSPVGLVLLWSVIIAEELAVWRLLHGKRAVGFVAAPRRTRVELSRMLVAEPDALEALPTRDDPSIANNVVQKLIRTQAAGVDRIQGWLRATFEAAERNETLHVAFCPPFDEIPTLTIVQISGPDCRIKTGQLLSYGVRLELKRALAEPEQADVVIEFSAQAPCHTAS